jgi:hypothetical protein
MSQGGTQGFVDELKGTMLLALPLMAAYCLLIANAFRSASAAGLW